MGILNSTIVLVQHFPATGEYIVHREGADVEIYKAGEEITDSAVNKFIRECLSGKLYHEFSVQLATGKGDGPRTLPTKQIVYCKMFEANNSKHKNALTDSNINWVLWAPNTHELSVNRGVLGVTRAMHLKDLNDAPDEVKDFMVGCYESDLIALSQHYSEPVREDGELKMVSVSEYFFSLSKVIYGFQHERVANITEQELRDLHLYQ